MLFFIDCLNLLFFSIKPRNNKKKCDDCCDNIVNHNILYNKNNKYNQPRYIIFPNNNKRLYINNILFV